jgi:hypothetical protein
MRFFIFYLFCLNSLHFICQLPTLDWAISNSGTGYLDISTGLVVDDLGNSYSIGTFMAQTDFDPGIGTFYLTPNGSEDVYIQKLNSSGQLIWAIQIGGNSFLEDDHAAEICLDHENNLLITGNFYGSGDFDPSTNSYILNSQGNSDCFIAKYTNNGDFIWAKSIGGGNIDAGRSIISLSNNDIIITGQFFGPIDFDPGIGSNYLYPTIPYNNGSLSYTTDFFTLKLSSSGDFIWANINGDYSDDICYSSIDSNDNIIQVGRFAGSIDIDPGTSVLNLYSGGNGNGYGTFIRKLSPTGNLIWAKSLENGLSSSADVLSVTVDNNDNIIMSGYFFGTIDFDPNNSIFNLTSNGASDCYTLKLNTNGDFLWVKSIGGNANGLEAGASLTNDNLNNIYVLGYLESPGSTVDFDNGPNSYFLSDDYGTFLVKYDFNGNLQWATRIERSIDLNQIFYCWETSSGPGITGGRCIKIEGNSIYISGAFSHTIDFDPSSSNFLLSTAPNPSSASSTDSFVHKLNFCQTSNITIDTTVCGSYLAPNDTSYNQTGTYYFQTTNGCDTNYTLNLLVNNQPITPVIYSNQQGILYTPYQQNVNYQWYFCSDNIMLANEVNDTLIPTTSSLYYVTVQNQCGIDTSDCYFYEDVSILEPTASFLRVFPNPSSNSIKIENHNYPNELSIVNNQGQFISKITVVNKNQFIDISNLKSGVYFFTDGVRFIRFIKE